jgi:hypothetical protein
LEVIFGSIYVAEAAIKLVAYSPKTYFSSKANCFDFLIVLAVIANWCFAALGGEELEMFRAIEAMRVLRVFRLFKLISAFRTLITTFLATLFPLLNISALMLLNFIVFGVVGMALFGGTVNWDQNGDSLKFLSPYANFDRFSNAFYLLFVMCTGESWNGYARELHTFHWAATPFCIIFIIISRFVIINLFVAIILTNYSTAFEAASRPDGVKRRLDDNSIRDFNEKWNGLYLEHLATLSQLVSDARKEDGLQHHVTKNAERLLAEAVNDPKRIPVYLFADLLLKLKAPLGFRKRTMQDGVKFNSSHVMLWIKNHDKDFPIVAGQLEYHTTLRALIDITLLEGNVPDNVRTLINLSNSSFQLPPSLMNESSSSLGSLTSGLSSKMTVSEVIAHDQVREMLRRWAIRWRLKKMRHNGEDPSKIRALVQESAAQSSRNLFLRQTSTGSLFRQDSDPSVGVGLSPTAASGTSAASEASNRITDVDFV